MNIDKNMIFTNLVATSLATTETMDGQDYLAVKVIPLKEGVHNGVFYPSAEIEKSTVCWNGQPVPVNHPQADGVDVSANTPLFNSTVNIGTVYNTTYADGKLSCEMWINKDKAARLGFQGIIDHFDNGKMMEVSTGLFADAVKKSGTFEGVAYDWVATNIKTDHIAVLPNAIGACSIADGCGAFRANADKVATAEHADCDSCAEAKELTLREKIGDAITTLGAKINGNDISDDRLAGQIKALLEGQIVSNEISHDQIDTQLRGLLRAEYTDGDNDWWPYIVAVYDSFFIFEIENKTYKRGYTNIDDVVALSGEATGVVLEMNWKDLKILVGNSAVINLSNGNVMNEIESKVDALIANADNAFKEADRAVLIALGEDLVAKPDAEAETVVEVAEVAEVATNGISDTQLATLARLEAKENAEIDALRALVAEANPSLKAETVAALSVEAIRDFASNIAPTADYSGMGGVVGNSGDLKHPDVCVGNFNKKEAA